MPGRMHDARVFRHSALFGGLTGNILPDNFHLIGDAAYPLLKNLITPFRDNGNLTPAQSRYNVRLSAIRSTIERTFGILKAKFRRLKYLDASDLVLANNIIAACAVLYNFISQHEAITIDYEDIIEDEENVNVYNEDEERLGLGEQKRNRIMNMLV